MEGILEGFSVALAPMNLLYVFLGVVIGNVIGVLPGLGPAATIALLLPLTYGLEPASAVIMLAGIYYGSMYGGTITSVLLRLPGEAASVVTIIEGYQMTKKGRAGAALGISAVGSFIGGTIAVIGLSLLAPVISAYAVRFGPPEYFILAVIGIFLVTYLGSSLPIKSMCMAAIGLFLATVGLDPISGTPRFSFGFPVLYDGFDMVCLAMGLFGVAEILHSIEQDEAVMALKGRIKNIWPSGADIKKSMGSILRGSVLGFFIGVMPGSGGLIGSMASYATEKRLAKNSGEFGHGDIRGVAGPETANNAGATASFIPLLTLGIPSNVVLALIFGALMLQGITPGPMLITDYPEIFWGVIASMYIGNIMLLVLNVPLVGIFVQLLRVRPAILAAVTLAVVMAGVYSVGNRVTDMAMMMIFGIIGWLMKKTGFDPAPMVLAFILGSILEEAFRQAMLLSDGSVGIFATRPISGTMFWLLVAFVIYTSVRRGVKKRRSGLDASLKVTEVTKDAPEPEFNRD